MMNRIYKHLQSQIAKKGVVELSSSTIASTAPDSKSIIIKFQRREIVKLLPNGTHILNTGGWRTPHVRATFESVIEKLGFTILQQAGIWYVAYLDSTKRDRYVFTDGMKITADGVVIGAKLDIKYPRVSKQTIKKYTSNWANAWQAGYVPAPSPADPYSFYGIVADKKKPNLAEMRQQTVDYFANDYYFGSLAMVAIYDIGGPRTKKLDLITKFHIEGWLKDGTLPPSKLLAGSALALKKILRQYLYKLHGIEGNSVKSQKGH